MKWHRRRNPYLKNSARLRPGQLLGDSARNTKAKQMKAKSQKVIVGTTLLLALISLRAGRLPCCAEEQAAAASAGQKQARLDNVSFYKVPLVCPAAPHIGCGSASKPLLLGLEHSEVVSEAWLNRAGTVMAVVWSG
jgi:hypothetical protein